MPDASLRRSGALTQEEGPFDDGRQPMERVAFALHEMCQPLMALQCRLEMGRMVGTADGYEEAVRESLVECDRLLLSVDALRGEILRGLEGGRPS